LFGGVSPSNALVFTQIFAFFSTTPNEPYFLSLTHLRLS
jgi:hypothetical protein